MPRLRKMALIRQAKGGRKPSIAEKMNTTAARRPSTRCSTPSICWPRTVTTLPMPKRC